MSLAFSISPASEIPIHRQITQHIRLALVQGHLQVGDQLPTVRALAESLVVNPNTVARVYQDLIRDGWLESRSGVGVFVSQKRVVYSDAERVRRLAPPLQQLVLEALVLGFSLPEITAALENQWRTLQSEPQRRKP